MPIKAGLRQNDRKFMWSITQTTLVLMWIGPQTILCCHVVRESVHYSSGQTENVPKVVEDGDSPLQSTLTVARM